MTRNWTVMVYMAGDNGRVFDGNRLMADLQKYGWRNIADMSSVGSTDEVAIVVQYDTLDHQQYTPRVFIDGQDPAGRLLDKIPPVNTGDPKNLSDFIIWAAGAYPAERFALILWNHGTGWKEDDIYARYRERVERAIHSGEVRSGGLGERLLQNALFLSTVGEIMSIEDDETRAICFDDTSMDFLDNGKLACALSDACKRIGQRFSVIGMDACLMSTIEVAHQIHEYAEYMVGSQEVELAPGWPYAKILGPLVQRPTMTPAELSRMIVDQFEDFYTRFDRAGGGVNTQSAINLGLVAQTFKRLAAISALLAENYPSDAYTELAVLRARDRAQSFQDEDSLDLRHFTEILRDEYAGSLPLKQLADDLLQHLMVGEPSGPIAANFHGLDRPHANGISIYFPRRRYSRFYDAQTFAASGWPDVIRRTTKE